jgi:hypothetical protein
MRWYLPLIHAGQANAIVPQHGRAYTRWRWGDGELPALAATSGVRRPQPDGRGHQDPTGENALDRSLVCQPQGLRPHAVTHGAGCHGILPCARGKR